MTVPTLKMRPGWILDPVPLPGGERIVLHPARPRWAVANGAGLRMIALLDGTRTAEAVIDALAAQWPAIPREQIAADTTAFLDALREADLLEGPAAPPAPAPPHKPPTLTIYLTEECNLRCKHCAVVEGKMPQTTLDASKVRGILDEHLARHPGATVTFLGGEPFLHPDCLPLLEHATRLGADVAVGTNGLLLDEEKIAALAALPLRIQVSVDGPDAESHEAVRGKRTHARTVAAVEALCAAGAAAKIVIACTLTKHVVARVDEMLAWVDRLAIGKIRFLPLQQDGAARSHWHSLEPAREDFERAMRYLLFEAPHRPGAVATIGCGFPGYVPNPPEDRHWCPLGATMIVDSQGAVHGCPAMTSPAVRMGNVHAASIAAVETSDAARAMRERMLARAEDVEDCRACAWRNFCRGGCVGFMAHRSGDWLRNDGFCDFRRELYRTNVQRKLAANHSP